MKKSMIAGLIVVLVLVSACAVYKAPSDNIPMEEEQTQPSSEVVEEAPEIGGNVKIQDVTEEEPQSLFPGGTILYQQDGVTFEHYFPYTGSLKGDESEILVYNRGTIPIQITSSNMKFIVAGRTYEQYSGTWEKFPSTQSWERIEYINIKPPYYQGQPLILDPGQKGKLHWHYQFAGEIWGKEQKVKIMVQYKIGTTSSTLNKEITRQDPGPRPSEEGHVESNSGGGQEVNH